MLTTLEQVSHDLLEGVATLRRELAVWMFAVHV